MSEDEAYDFAIQRFKNRIEGKRVYIVKLAYGANITFILINGEPEVINDVWAGISQMVTLTERGEVKGIQSKDAFDDFSRHVYGKTKGFAWTFLN